MCFTEQNVDGKNNLYKPIYGFCKELFFSFADLTLQMTLWGFPMYVVNQANLLLQTRNVTLRPEHALVCI